MAAKSDFEHWQIDATVHSDRVEETHLITDPLRNIRQKPQTVVWHVEKFLGRGGCGEVRLERQKESNKARAVKRIVTATNLSHSEWKRELKALLEFSKPKYKDTGSFVDFLGWFQHGSEVFLAMEYVLLGDLETNVKALSAPLPQVEAKDITQQILLGLQIMHAESFAHRDLKPQNVLVVNGSPEWWVKLADFGLSKRLTETTAYYTRSGTQFYMAPEILDLLDSSSAEYTNAVDLWALGCITYRIVSGVVPFPSVKALLKYCEDKALFPLDALFDAKIESLCFRFVKELLAPYPGKRPSASQALSHDWICRGSQGGIHNGHSPPHPSHEISEGLPPTPSFQGTQPPVPTSSATNYNTETHDGLKTNVLDPLSNPGEFSSQLPPEASDRGSEHEILSLEGEANQITLKPAPSRVVPWAKPISPFSPIAPLQSSVSLGGHEQSTDIALDLYWTQTRPLADLQSIQGLHVPVIAMAFSPESSFFAVGAKYGGVDIWQPDPDSNLRLCYSGTVGGNSITSPDGASWTDIISSLKFSADGYELAGASFNQKLLLWDPLGHGLLAASIPAPESDSTGTIRISPNMDLYAKGSSYNGDIQLCDIASRDCKAVLRGHWASVTSLCFSFDGRLLASTSIDRRLHLWNTADGACVQKFLGNSSSPVVISPDSKLLASSSENFAVKIWSVQDKTPLHRLSGHSGRVLSLAFSTDSTVLASGSEDGVVRLWNVSSGLHLNIRRWRSDVSVCSLAFLFNDHVLAVGTSNGNVCLFGQQERVTSSKD